MTTPHPRTIYWEKIVRSAGGDSYERNGALISAYASLDAALKEAGLSGTFLERLTEAFSRKLIASDAPARSARAMRNDIVHRWSTPRTAEVTAAVLAFAVADMQLKKVYSRAVGQHLGTIETEVLRAATTPELHSCASSAATAVSDLKRGAALVFAAWQFEQALIQANNFTLGTVERFSPMNVAWLAPSVGGPTEQAKKFEDLALLQKLEFIGARRLLGAKDVEAAKACIEARNRFAHETQAPSPANAPALVGTLTHTAMLLREQYLERVERPFEREKQRQSQEAARQSQEAAIDAYRAALEEAVISFRWEVPSGHPVRIDRRTSGRTVYSRGPSPDPGEKYRYWTVTFVLFGLPTVATCGSCSACVVSGTGTWTEIMVTRAVCASFISICLYVGYRLWLAHRDRSVAKHEYSVELRLAQEKFRGDVMVARATVDVAILKASFDANDTRFAKAQVDKISAEFRKNWFS